MKKFKRVIKIIAKILLVLALVLVAAVFVIRFAGKRQLDAQIAVLRAKGEPVTFDDLYREKIPQKQNAALIVETIIRKMNDLSVEKDIEILTVHNKDDFNKDPQLQNKAIRANCKMLAPCSGS